MTSRKECARRPHKEGARQWSRSDTPAARDATGAAKDAHNNKRRAGGSSETASTQIFSAAMSGEQIAEGRKTLLPTCPREIEQLRGQKSTASTQHQDCGGGANSCDTAATQRAQYLYSGRGARRQASAGASSLRHGVFTPEQGGATVAGTLQRAVGAAGPTAFTLFKGGAPRKATRVPRAATALRGTLGVPTTGPQAT